VRALLRSGLSRWLGLPAPVCPVFPERSWVTLPDGVRLATLHWWPVGRRDAPVVLVRTADGCDALGSPASLLGRVLAEQGHHAVVQDVRGRFGSEGRFAPFHHEAADGAATLDWLRAHGWARGRLGLAGWGYGAFAAWAVLGAAPEGVDALVAVEADRDPWRGLHEGGALRLEEGLSWLLRLGDRSPVPSRQIDLGRALVFRPVRDADRVALRRCDAWQDWTAHPRRDAWWRALAPPLPERPPAALLAATLGGRAAPGVLADREALAAAGAPVRLLLGPARPRRAAARAWLREVLRSAIDFLGRSLDGEAAATPGARVFVQGAGWRDAGAWPPARAASWSLGLHPPAAGAPGPARLVPGEPSAGGELARFRAGSEGRGRRRTSESALRSLARFVSEPLAHEAELAGPVRARLAVSADREDLDLCVRLLECAADGRELLVCRGYQRARWRESAPEESQERWLVPGEPAALDVDLGHAAHRVAAGRRLVLEVSGEDLPRCERGTGGREDPLAAGPEAERPVSVWLLAAAGEARSGLSLTVEGGLAVESERHPTGRREPEREHEGGQEGPPDRAAAS